MVDRQDLHVRNRFLRGVILVLLLMMGPAGADVAPLAGGAVVALFLLAFLYGRWLLPGLKGRQVLALVLFKELAVALLLGFIFGLIVLIRFLLGA